MEQEKIQIDITKFIKVYENFLPLNVLPSFLKWLNNQNFLPAAVVGHDNEGVLDTGIRRTEQLNLGIHEESTKTSIHWSNFLSSFFLKAFTKYENDVTPFHKVNVNGIVDMAALKYEKAGFYKFHTDHHFSIPRTMTCIVLLNNDYEGGELEFASPLTNEPILKIPKLANSIILWPSNFMYPHRVNPVTNGKRFSIVAWLF